jgi:hypothetical protein
MEPLGLCQLASSCWPDAQLTLNERSPARVRSTYGCHVTPPSNNGRWFPTTPTWFKEHQSARPDTPVFTLFTHACTASPMTGRAEGITWHRAFARQSISREHLEPQIYNQTCQMRRDRTPSRVRSVDCSLSKRFLLTSPYVVRDRTHPSTTQVTNTLSVRSQAESAPHCAELTGRAGPESGHASGHWKTSPRLH